MNANEARREIVQRILDNLPASLEVLVRSATPYGFTLKVGEHRIRFSAQVESNKHPTKKKAVTK